MVVLFHGEYFPVLEIICTHVYSGFTLPKLAYIKLTHVMHSPKLALKKEEEKNSKSKAGIFMSHLVLLLLVQHLMLNKIEKESIERAAQTTP